MMTYANTKSILVRFAFGLACVAGLWLLGAMLMSTPRSSASGTLLLPFDSPLLTVDKAVQGEVSGASITYTISVSNAGSDAAHSVVVTDAVPTGATYLSGGSHADGVVTLNVGAVPGFGQNSATWVVSTCQTNLTNQWYRVVTSTEGVSSAWGTPLVTNLSTPSITADFDLAPTPVAADATVAFTDTSATDGGPLVAWDWDFGDDEAASGREVTHTYAYGGAYTVTLTVTDTCGIAESSLVPNAVVVLPFRVFVPLVVKPGMTYLPTIRRLP